MPGGRGMELCWDNVAYQSQSLGYIYDQHQELNRAPEKYVISLYMPLDAQDDKAQRREVEKRSKEAWREIVLEELKKMHPDIQDSVEDIELCVWGHGMILPTPGLSKGTVLKELASPIQDKLFFAHSDLAAYSTFEEAFDQGARVADLLKVKMA